MSLPAVTAADTLLGAELVESGDILELHTRPGNPSYRFVTILDGERWEFIIRFNDRDGSYYASIKDPDAAPAEFLDTSPDVPGREVKLVANFPLLDTWTSERRPLGALMVVDERTIPFEAGLDELGATHRLLYTTEAGVDAIDPGDDASVVSAVATP